ncbi:MAG: UPF0182 family protein [Desulfarculaceae bacterium]|nr:UPF0182 family protein [Desulfarculaceae bacterium]
MAILTICFFGLLSFWGEMLWYRSLGFERRFWRLLGAEYGLAFLGAFLGWLVLSLATLRLPTERRVLRWGGRGIAALIGFMWGVNKWPEILKFLAGIKTGQNDPILGRDISFYLFGLPFWDSLYSLLFWVLLVAMATVLAGVYLRVKTSGLEVELPPDEDRPATLLMPVFFVCSGAMFMVLAGGVWLDRYHLLFSTWGVVHGPGWTDVHVRLPGYWGLTAVLLLAGLWLWLPGLRNWARRVVVRRLGGTVPPRLSPLVTAGIAGLAVWLLILVLAPQLFQWLKVEPNEITLEQPYIANNIAFTRKAFGLDRVEEREFPASDSFTRTMVDNVASLLANVRLWDQTALKAVYQQFQEIRLYYEFVGIDIDRYTYDGNYRQVMVSAREMQPDNLPSDSQTFVNRRFKYTHGYGITMNPVHKFTSQGLPDLLIKNIPPKAKYPELKVTRPEIYYGEATTDHVIANSEEKEFNYPQGDENAYNRYSGRGGVQLSSLWRKFIYGWKFDGTRLFFSDYPNRQSRILFRRQVIQRLKEVAPFLEFDTDPYIVLSKGRLFWMVDAYTTSSYYPYSAPFETTRVEHRQQELGEKASRREVLRHLAGANYVRNSVKAVVDAYQGEVRLYVFTPHDPIIQTWRRIFPGLFHDRSQMPSGLERHIRYPADLLLVQGLKYAKYHMTDPEVFYNQEDLWVRATEKYYSQVVPVQPYYVMWQPTENKKLQFALILPFTPKNRQVLIGWIAGMCDPPNYGRFLAYKFPKEKRVLGTQQVETKIDQDPHLSSQLTLWDQRGSKVIRGNVLVIPIADSLLYVEPIYLQAETAAYPEMRLVVLMQDDVLSYADSFDKALEGLLGGSVGAMPQTPAVGGTGIYQLIQQARQAFDNYLKAQGEGRFRQAAKALEQLQRSLEQLAKEVRGKQENTATGDGT